MQRKTFSFLALMFFLLAGCSDDPPSGDLVLELVSGAYKPTSIHSLESCSQYLSSNEGDAQYWIDPDGAGTGIDEFKVTCDMTNGGYTVFEATTSPSFPHTNTTDTTLTFYTSSELTKVNAVRSISNSVTVDSDITLRFSSDTASGGCGGTPTIPQGDMEAFTLPLDTHQTTTVTKHEFYGSSDNVDVTFDNSTNEFGGTTNHSCGDTIINRFGVGDKVFLTEVLLKNISSRAYSRLSGTYYKLKMK